MFEQLRENRRRAEEERREKEEQRQQEEARKKREKKDLERAISETILTISAESWARMRSKKLVKYDAFFVDASAGTVNQEVPSFAKCKHEMYQRAQELGAEAVVDVRPIVTNAKSGGNTYSAIYLIGTALVPKQKPVS